MKLNTIFFLALIFFLASCGGGGRTPQQQTTRRAPAKAKDTQAMANHPGKKVYTSVCLVCHMADGSGMTKTYPPLTETEMVNGDKDRLIDIILNGQSGEIVVKGETYNNLMPPHSHLSDKQISDVLTYVRQSFGNNSSEITVEDVQKVRNKTR